MICLSLFIANLIIYHCGRELVVVRTRLLMFYEKFVTLNNNTKFPEMRWLSWNWRNKVAGLKLNHRRRPGVSHFPLRDWSWILFWYFFSGFIMCMTLFDFDYDLVIISTYYFRNGCNLEILLSTSSSLSPLPCSNRMEERRKMGKLNCFLEFLGFTGSFFLVFLEIEIINNTVK